LKTKNRNAFDGKKEGEIAALLTNHFLSRLIYGNRYLISHDNEKQPSQCPCLQQMSCKEEILYGQTGLGEI
jgi:hypothetical protein